MNRPLRVEKLEPAHRVDGFDSGAPPLDRFLIRHALQGQRAGASRTYIALQDDRVVGYHSLAVGEVAYEDAAERLAKGMARHPVPIMLLARLAVARDMQGQGIGAGLLKDALLRTAQAASIAGIRALVVHAKDDTARAFYERYDFAPSPTDPLHLHLLLKHVRALLGSYQQAYCVVSFPPSGAEGDCAPGTRLGAAVTLRCLSALTVRAQKARTVEMN